jgi:hypothetical protein
VARQSLQPESVYHPLAKYVAMHSGFGQNTSKYSSIPWLFSFAQLTDEFLSFKPFFAPFHRLMGSYLCDTGPNICDNKQFTQNGDYPHGIRNELEASEQ